MASPREKNRAYNESFIDQLEFLTKLVKIKPLEQVNEKYAKLLITAID